MPKRIAPALLLFLGALVAALVLIPLARGVEPDYAYLVPAPDDVVWEQGSRTTVWLNTNRKDVELRVASADLGFGSIERVFPESGASMVLARREGCPATAGAALDLVRDTGVGLIACAVADDVAITLHGDEGEELNRYLVDIQARPTSVPASPPNGAGYSIRRVCVDSAVHYLSGGELVGDAFDGDAFGLSGTIRQVQLADTAPENRYRYFFAHSLTAGDVQLRITDVGAIGLDANQVYPVRLTATDNRLVVADDPDTDEDEAVIGVTAHLDVGVWVDVSTLSPGDDGQCS